MCTSNRNLLPPCTALHGTNGGPMVWFYSFTAFDCLQSFPRCIPTTTVGD